MSREALGVGGNSCVDVVSHQSFPLCKGDGTIRHVERGFAHPGLEALVSHLVLTGPRRPPQLTWQQFSCERSRLDSVVTWPAW